MTHKPTYIACLFVVLLLTGCNNTSSEQRSNDYFDLHTYLDGEIKRIGSTTDVVKVVYEDEKLIDSVRILDYNVARDLEEFRSSAIHLSSKTDLYNVDTTLEASKKIISYVSNSDKNTTDKVQVVTSGSDKIILISRTYESIISDMDQEIEMHSGGYYKIDSRIVDNIGKKDMQLSIKVIWGSKE